MRIRLILGIWACRFAIFASRLLGKKGTSMPGQVAMKICPNIISLLSAQVKEKIIAVCGTNGKTTTNTLLASMIESAGHRVVCNSLGANMIWGVCCAFCEQADFLGRLRADYACLEVDEASTVKVFAQLKPDYMLVTNLFQDQLDRYGEVDLTVGFLKKALEISKDTQLILNGDDPVVAQLGEKTDRKCYYISVDEEVKCEDEGRGEGRLCPFCSTALSYEFHHYSQLGKFHCENCGYAHHTPDFRIHSVQVDDGLSFVLDYQNESAQFSVKYRGFYNIYNIGLSFSGAVLAMGKAPEHRAVLEAYQPQIGRMESFTIGEKTVILNLAKNPAGFNQALETVLEDNRKKNVLLAVNDNPSDGQDVSWLWSVDFERLSQANVHQLVVTGLRGDELMLRMKYAGFSEESQKKTQSLKEAVLALLSGDADICYALVNYTVVFTMQEILKAMEGEA